MINMMVIDDEAVIRRGIKTSIDWHLYDVNIVGEAGNGKEGLAKALNLRPDIVITDIRMPLMDGLELSAQLKEKLPNTKIVILSGYNDFAYAREALKLGVCEYLLKPVGAEELIKLAIRLRDEIYENLEKLDKEISTNLILNENLPYIQSKFINSILKGYYTNNELIFQKASKIKVYLSGPQYQILIIDIDDFLLLTEHSSEKDKELMKFSVMNIAEEVFRSVSSCTVCYSEFDFLIAIVNIDENNKRLIGDACKELQYCVKKYLKILITISIGRVYQDIREITRSYSEALMALRNKIFKGKDRIIHIDDTDIVYNNSFILNPTEGEKELVNCLKVMNIEGINLILSELFKNFSEKKVSYEQIKYICIKLIIISIAQLEEIGIYAQDCFGHTFNVYSEIDKYETIDDIERWLRILFKELVNMVKENKSRKYKSIVKYALQYVNDHYSENIRIEDIASMIFVTPNYFSRVFKEEIGENFIEWLNKFRVEKAKSLLLNTRLKTYEIAESIGYNDYKYFNYIFKRYAGCTPMEYRDN